MNDFSLVIDTDKLKKKPHSFPDCFTVSTTACCQQDSFLYQHEGNTVLFLGLCFNKAKLLAHENEKKWSDYASRQLLQDQKRFLAQLDGSFCGLVYKAQDNFLALFTDHLASQPLYCFSNAQLIIADTNLFRLVSHMRRYHIPVRVSDLGGYSMLAYSFMLDAFTPISDVYKLRPSTLFFPFDQNTTTYLQLYPDEKRTEFQLSDIADGINEYFSEAVSNRFCIDGNRKHLVTLSGGLDSRMCLLYALRLGFDNISTLCYSQSFYCEELISKRISADFRCEHLFFSLDGGHYLSHIEPGILATHGMTTYRPILSARLVWDKLQMDRFGLVHTGLLGDTVLGGYCIGKCNSDDRFHSALDLAMQLNPKNKSLLSAPYKEKLLPFFDDILDWIPSAELLSLRSEKFVLMNRYCNGLIQSYLGLRDLAMLSSPFVSKDLMRYVFSFPSDIRINHKLYFRWMERHMPAAMKYQWENTGLPPSLGHIRVPPDSWVAKTYQNLYRVFRKEKPERSRNPYQYWMRSDAQILDDIRLYCLSRLPLLECSPRLLQFVKTILQYDNIYLSTRAATLLGTLSLCHGYEPPLTR